MTQSITKTATVALVLLLVLTLLLPLAATAEEDVRYVSQPSTGEMVPLLKSPSAEGKVQGYYFAGTAARALEEKDGYTKVAIGEFRGYIESQYLTYDRENLAVVGYATVNNEKAGEKLTLRGEPSTTAKALGKYENGVTVQILGEKEGFYHVRAYDKEGYMIKDNLLVDGTPSKEELTKLTAAYVGARNLNMRAFPDKGAPALGKVSKEHVTILGVAGPWLYVELSRTKGTDIRQQRGFILMQYVDTIGDYSAEAASSAYDYVVGIVKGPKEGDRLNLREKAKKDSDSLGKYFNNTQVKVLNPDDFTKKSVKWMHVEVDGKEGYMEKEYLALVNSTDPSTWKSVR